MPADTRSYEERHAHDTHTNITRHLLIQNYGDEFLGFTEFIQGGLERELDMMPLREFLERVRDDGGLRDHAENLIDMHKAWGVDA